MQIEIEKFFTQIGVRLPNLVNCGQYFKHFTSVKYDPRVVKWAIFQSYDSRVVNYHCKVPSQDWPLGLNEKLY